MARNTCVYVGLSQGAKLATPEIHAAADRRYYLRQHPRCVAVVEDPPNHIYEIGSVAASGRDHPVQSWPENYRLGQTAPRSARTFAVNTDRCHVGAIVFGHLHRLLRRRCRLHHSSAAVHRGNREHSLNERTQDLARHLRKRRGHRSFCRGPRRDLAAGLAHDAGRNNWRICRSTLRPEDETTGCALSDHRHRHRDDGLFLLEDQRHVADPDIVDHWLVAALK